MFPLFFVFSMYYLCAKCYKSVMVYYIAICVGYLG